MSSYLLDTTLDKWVPVCICDVLGVLPRVNLEHKAEHNNCRMRGIGPDLEALNPTVSP
jgi:hypothetical protein